MTNEELAQLKEQLVIDPVWEALTDGVAITMESYEAIGGFDLIKLICVSDLHDALGSGDLEAIAYAEADLLDLDLMRAHVAVQALVS